MTIGKKFLERVLNEGQLDEAKKDVDGFKDAFDITTLPPTSPAVANLPLPLARQVVQLYHLMGVSVETLEMRPKAVKEAAMAVADEMRTNAPLRRAAQRLFSALATAKGFARKEEEMMEASASMTPEKDVRLMGGAVVKQMEAMLAALKLPAGVLQRAMRRDQGTMMETADILRTGAGRSKFAMLASELGVDLMSIGQTVKVQEAVSAQTTFTPGRSWTNRDWARLRDVAGFEWDMTGDDDENPDHVALTVLNSNAGAMKKAQAEVARGVLKVSAGRATRDTASGYARDVAKAGAKKVAEAGPARPALADEDDPKAIQKASAVIQHLINLQDAQAVRVVNMKRLQMTVVGKMRSDPKLRRAVDAFLRVLGEEV